MPVRKIPRKYHGSTNRGVFPSLRMARGVEYESGLERDYFFWLEFENDVLSYEQQPFRIRFLHEHETRAYVPDLVVFREGKTQLVEIKPFDRVSEERNLMRFAAAQEYCQAKNFEFVVVTERQIRVKPVLDNIKLLFRYARTITSLPYGSAELAKHLLRSRTPFDAIVKHYANHYQDEAKTIVMALLFRQVIQVDMTQPLTGDSILYWGEDDRHDGTD